MSQAADEFLHNLKHGAQQQGQDYAPFVYAHIANYDPATHRVRVILPSNRNEDDVPVLTAWMPLNSVIAGNGWGLQIAPMGGATVDSPTGGELVVVQRLDRGLGVQAVASMVWNQVNVPPDTGLQPGEVVLKGKAGSMIKMDKDGNMDVAAGGSGSVTVSAPEGNVTVEAAQGDVTVTAAAGNATVSAPGGTVSITSPSISLGDGGALTQLVTDALVAKYNTHTHPANNQPVPIGQRIGAGELSSVVKAQ